MRRPNPLTLFWAAVAIDVVALGVAWSTWKLVATSPIALLAAIPATLVCATATLVAARILAVLTRAKRPPAATRRASPHTRRTVR